MDDNEKTNDDSKFTSEDESRLIESYNNANKKFVQSFSILLGFSLIFIFVILFPYISTIEKGLANEKRLNTTILSIEKNKNISDYIKQSDFGLHNLTNLLNEYQYNLDRSFLNLILIPMESNKINNNKEIEDALSIPQSSHRLNSLKEQLNSTYNALLSYNFPNITSKNFTDCRDINKTLIEICNLKNRIYNSVDQRIASINQTYFLEQSEYRYPNCDADYPIVNDTWIKCNIRMKIQEEINRMNNTLINNITSPLKMSGNDTIPEEDIRDLTFAFNNLKDKSNNLADKASLNFVWDAVDAFKNVSNETIGSAQKNLENYISSLNDYQYRELMQLNQTQNETIQEKNKYDSNKEKIAIRLEQIQFPFGKLPITLNESIVAFPIALGIGFVISSFYLSDSIRIRKELHYWYKKKYKESSKESLKKRTLLLTPLWIDPLSSTMNIVLKYTIFVIPLVIFAVSCYFIISYILFGQDKESSDSLFYYEPTYLTYIFITLYVLSMVLFSAGLFTTLRETHRYKSLH